MSIGDLPRQHSQLPPGPAKVLTAITVTKDEDVNAAGNTAVNYFCYGDCSEERL